ncbi:G5 domain-containing protein [Kribbella sp. NPDC026596]|uniref:G5 domain-containing protein n=1 Tax=Kribbella sp. NPDC026596 TaxID=3155122 RepID=UPI0033E17306
MHFIRAALAPVALLAVGALATGCGSPSGTSNAGEPAAIASIRVTTTPASTPAATPTPTTKATPTTTATAKKPTTTTKRVVEFRTIPFKKKTVTDDSMPKGEKTIRTTGVNGTRRLTYEVTYVDGVQTTKELLKQEVAKQPRTQVTAVGTKVEEESGSSGCDPNYSGACVPIASDVDCSGGSGNGPAYVRGPVTVVGVDIYDLDRDGDGTGCDS